MHIYVDESGTFTHSTDLDSWCVVAAYVAPEHKRRQIEELASQIRALNKGAETKGKHLTENQYVSFLQKLEKLGGLVFAVAVDVGLHRPDVVALHRDLQAKKVVAHREKMQHEAARNGLTELSEQIRRLPQQLYTQLICQVHLFHTILSRSTLYFVQRHPPSLAHFRWRLDQKARVPTEYETAFQKLLPALLQTMSIDDPMLMLEGADYRHLSRYEYPAGEEPTYLKDNYGFDVEGGANVGRMIREDFRLVDSATTPGIQIADLVAGGIFRLFRRRFQAEEKIALLLGANMVQTLKHEPPLGLVSLDRAAPTTPKTAHLIRLMASAARPMLIG